MLILSVRGPMQLDVKLARSHLVVLASVLTEMDYTIEEGFMESCVDALH